MWWSEEEVVKSSVPNYISFFSGWHVKCAVLRYPSAGFTPFCSSLLGKMLVSFGESVRKHENSILSWWSDQVARNCNTIKWSEESFDLSKVNNEGADLSSQRNPCFWLWYGIHFSSTTNLKNENIFVFFKIALRVADDQSINDVPTFVFSLICRFIPKIFRLLHGLLSVLIPTPESFFSWKRSPVCH